MLKLWLAFLVCSGVIVVCGSFLSIFGDVIAEKVGLGRAWIGLILMAGVTSLPELMNGISSVTMADAPDLALGDVMGSCLYNIALVAFLDILYRPGPIFSRAEHGHIISAGFGIILIGVASVSMLSNSAMPSLGSVGLYTPLIIFIYLVGIRSVFLFEKRKRAESAGEIAAETSYADISMREAVVKYTINAVIIIAAATMLPFIGDRIATETGLGRSFVGTFFIGMTTSLPELVVSIAALRIGAVDMAIANLFGSNMFNILILAVDDIFYTKGPLLTDVSNNHVITGVMAAVMTGVAVVGLTYRLKRKTFLRLGWDAISVLIIYLITILLLYTMRGPS